MQKKYKHYLDSLRLERWPRSLAIVPGFIAYIVLEQNGTNLLNIELWGKLIIAFILTWLISTANYIINEITDAPYDAFHPAKKDRPLVKDEISKTILMILWFILMVISLGIAYYFFDNTYFLVSLVSLCIAGILYNVPPIRVKDIPFLDSTLESANNPIRFLIGWHILGNVFPPVYLLISWWFFGNFLMVGKRVAEKKFLTQEESAGYRLSLKKYSIKSLIAFMIANSVIFIVTFILFVIESKLNSFLYSTPFILFYLIMFMKKSMQDIEGAEEPERLLKNPYFALYTLFLAIIFIFAYIFK